MSRTAPALRVWTPGDLLTAAYMNAVNYAVTFAALNRPQCLAYQTITQPISSSATALTANKMLWDTELVDSDGFHSTSSNTSRFVAPWAAWYDLDGIVGMATISSGRKGGQWAINGTAVAQTLVLLHDDGTTGGSLSMASTTQYLNAGDYAELWGVQDSGSAVNTTTGANGSFARILFGSF